MPTAQQKQAAMHAERQNLTQLFTTASNDDLPGFIKALAGQTVHSAVTGYLDGRRRSALHFAAMHWSTRVLEYVESECDEKQLGEMVEMKDKEGVTPLMCLSQGVSGKNQVRGGSGGLSTAGGGGPLIGAI